MKSILILLADLALLVTACGTTTLQATPTGSPTQSSTSTAAPSDTLLPPTPTDTPIPIAGKTRTQINVRGGPGASFASLGLLGSGQNVQVVESDAAGTWYMILFPAGPSGHGWVAAAYVQVDNPADVPTAQQTITATPSGPTGQVMQKLNVRSGPGTTYDTLGMLVPKTIVVLTGKNDTATWLQIEYAAAAGGHGWVTAAYVQVQDIASLPVLDAYGKPVPVGAQTGTPAPEMTPTPTVGPAPEDGDSAASPAIRVTFSPSGAGQFSYSGQASAPQGDSQDWIEFTPYAADGPSTRVTVSLICSGNGTLRVELLQSGLPLTSWGSLQCGDVDRSIALTAGTTYQFHLSAAPGSGLRLVTYTLTVRNEP
ncbi:MAG: SH3 domain-containing protein [Anaerolineales bacterium]|jgi:uncharacterized protein YraI